ncbi:methenyl tetrahydrofolate cyclohydrolase / NADP-dependent methylene H4F dehydrogenase [Cavenderia fasciculata]|uniref:methenyltetrahydrofolate cyclohydrolase n=1 Tax=Cavenderia fasciculata TaxID=261658 RepID=F4QBZ7_CACFS|nr:methenyl tetrahydrofolate cyclohydrolase / NADP-dependent methylene H4F dehydrogenase [Cavenderia fasciculata]EGG14735.1 methenyl tetrahydrofolate cyclohydrolase / NADP-dependent methylene H4F dehydrogenase [Cavenderia fasciculata]|eukprot:XP_004351243.1 methenyl tetrahydrofolate cyclohydrolase / NADP-dependent methylene H4F dehydrogenase [Cavenderia fasciculata]
MSDSILESIERESKSIKDKGVIPHLVVIYIGDNPQIDSYVRKKREACERVGFKFTLDRFSSTVQQDQIIKRIQYHSQDTSVSGIILQLPLPEQLDSQSLIQAISPLKDVDGLNPLNLAQIFMGKKSMFVPCTPDGILELLRQYGFKVEGSNVVVLGRSNLVGRTIATLLSQKNLSNQSIQGGATVSLIHRYSKNTKPALKAADLIISATGQGGLIKKDDIKEGAVLIDVGISYVKDESKKSGVRMVGDIDPEAYKKAMAYTPVPGGVGPLTVAMLLKNVLKAAHLQAKIFKPQQQQQEKEKSQQKS